MIDVSLDGEASAFRDVEDFIEQIKRDATKHFAMLGLDPETELSVVLTDNESIRTLNLKWNQNDVPTDVLSFPQYQPGELPEGPCAIGDVVISLEYAEQTLGESGHRERVEGELGEPVDAWPIESEIAFLLIHGLLHLVGYDHDTSDAETQMKAMERTLWLSRGDA